MRKTQCAIPLSAHAFHRNENLINLGAYNRGVNPRIDRAINLHEKITGFLRQVPEELTARAESFARLKEVLR